MSWDIALSETKSVDYSACVVLRQRTSPQKLVVSHLNF
jgi:phage terminase large subunit-like protein